MFKKVSAALSAQAPSAAVAEIHAVSELSQAQVASSVEPAPEQATLSAEPYSPVSTTEEEQEQEQVINK